MCDEKVNRCECVHKTFEQLKVYADFDTAQAVTGCATECEGCTAYIKLMFACGETEFDIEDPRLSLYE